MTAPRPRTLSVLGFPALLDVAEERGLDRARLLREAGISPSVLDDPRGQIPVERERALVEALLARTGDPALGIQVGRRYPLTAFGLLGSVVPSVPSPREAIALFVEHLHLTYTPFTVVLLEPEGEAAQLRWLDEEDLGPLRRFYLDRDLVFVLTTASTLWPEHHRALVVGVDIDYPEPPEAGRYRRLAPCSVRFGADRSAALLDLSAAPHRPEANPLAFRLLREHLEEVHGGPPGPGIVDRVRREIAVSVGAQRLLPDESRVAAALGVTTRTLRRRLAAEGVAFRALRDEALAVHARRHLRDGRLAVSEVAERLGYADAVAFIRAFRRWTGETPDRFRRRVQVEEPRL